MSRGGGADGGRNPGAAAPSNRGRGREMTVKRRTAALIIVAFLLVTCPPYVWAAFQAAAVMFGR